MPYRDQALLIFGPDGKFLDRPLFGACRVWRVNEANKGRWCSPEAADLPSGDPAPLTLTTLTLTLTHGPKYRTARQGIRIAGTLAGA